MTRENCTAIRRQQVSHFSTELLRTAKTILSKNLAAALTQTMRLFLNNANFVICLGNSVYVIQQRSVCQFAVLKLSLRFAISCTRNNRKIKAFSCYGGSRRLSTRAGENWTAKLIRFLRKTEIFGDFSSTCGLSHYRTCSMHISITVPLQLRKSS